MDIILACIPIVGGIRVPLLGNVPVGPNPNYRRLIGSISCVLLMLTYEFIYKMVVFHDLFPYRVLTSLNDLLRFTVLFLFLYKNPFPIEHFSTASYILMLIIMVVLDITASYLDHADTVKCIRLTFHDIFFQIPAIYLTFLFYDLIVHDLSLQMLPEGNIPLQVGDIEDTFNMQNERQNLVRENHLIVSLILLTSLGSFFSLSYSQIYVENNRSSYLVVWIYVMWSWLALRPWAAVAQYNEALKSNEILLRFRFPNDQYVRVPLIDIVINERIYNGLLLAAIFQGSLQILK